MTESYLDMMEESLNQKVEVLESIVKENEIQKQILEDDEHFDGDGFSATISRKGELIGRIETLNDGFETLYERVKEELDGNKDKYRDRASRGEAHPCAVHVARFPDSPEAASAG